MTNKYQAAHERSVMQVGIIHHSTAAPQVEGDVHHFWVRRAALSLSIREESLLDKITQKWLCRR